MLRGRLAGLRARRESDIPALHAELYEEVHTRVRADSRPWRPIPAGSPASPYQPAENADGVAAFSVDELATSQLAGEALLWGIDRHNRTAHIGVSLLPAFRGRGMASDIVRVLCHYGFDILGLHRLQVETLSDNLPMIRAAEQAGFQREGTLRRSAWVNGAFADEVVLGLLASGSARGPPDQDGRMPRAQDPRRPAAVPAMPREMSYGSHCPAGGAHLAATAGSARRH